jgi:tRNA-dihydrouridine synthase
MEHNADGQRTMRIGNLELKSRHWLAPLEGVSDVGFRRLCYQNGAAITWTEMVRGSGIVRRNKATLDLLDTHDPDTLTGVQLFVVNERELAVALYQLEQLAHSSMPHLKNIRAIDLNFGCPSPDIIRIGAGPALLKRSTKMGVLFDKLRHWQRHTKLPVDAIGAKIRLGLNQLEQDHKVYLRIIDAANAHLDYLTVHARHAKQKSHDTPSWGAIAEIKRAAQIPIVGNGNVLDKASAERMLRETGCDGTMLARAAIADPWVFRELTTDGEGKRPTPDEIAAARDAYLAIAKQHGTKPKYLAFHEQNFARMLRGSWSDATPASDHLN